MMGLGLLFAGLSGAGKGLAQSAAQNQRTFDEKMLMEERAKLEEEKQLRIDQVTRDRTRAAQVQQGQDIQAGVTKLQNERDAEAINQKFGSSMSAEDAQALRGNEDARKAYGLMASTSKGDYTDRATVAENLGYLDAARDARGMVQVEQANERQAAADKKTDILAEYQKRREARLDRMAESELAWRKLRANTEDARYERLVAKEQQAATATALRSTQDDIKALTKEAEDPMLAPEQKKEIKTQIDTLRSEASRYRKVLAGAGLQSEDSDSGKPDKPFNPADFRTNPGATSSQGKSTPPPASVQAPPQRDMTPTEMALSGLDRAINQTARQLAAASSRGDKAEEERLNSLLLEQQAAKQRALKLSGQ